MRTFPFKLVAIFTLFLIACFHSSAQTCKATLTGTSCVGDSITAHFKGGTLGSLTWLWSDINNSERPIFYSSVNTVAGGNGSGAGDNQFSGPTSVYVDKQGNVYVADAANNRIQKWAPNATSGVTVAGGNGEGDAANQLSSPEGVFVDAAGNIYVADTHNWRVQKWTPGATSGITVAGGNGFGSDANQLYYPTGVFVDAETNVYVSDFLNNRIQKWTPGATSGITVAGGNDYGSAANQLAYPKSIYVDAQKNIYIADYFNHRIQKWAPNATSGITVAGGNGQGNAANQLNYPTSVYLDSAGNIFIADSYNARVQKWAPAAIEGTTIGIGNYLANPYGVFVDSNENVYVVENGDSYYGNNFVYEYLSHVINNKLGTSNEIGGRGEGSYRVVATSTTGCIDTSNIIKVFIPAKISGIKGQTTGLCGGGDFKYTVQFNFWGQRGIYDTTGIILNWSVPKGCTILSGQGTATLKLRIPPDFVKGNLKVIGHLCNTADTFVTEISTKPYISEISGFAYVNPHEKGLIYSVQSDSVLYYTWTVPNGASIVSGQGTSRIKVNWGASKGNVIVKSATCADTAIRKLYVVFIDSTHHPSTACGKDSLKVSFKGKAPYPWAIDGKTKDWETLLGPSTGDNYHPYYPPLGSAFNWAPDVSPDGNDYDWPKPENDIQFTAFIHDDYNVYFYLRRLSNGSSPNTFLYFCDVNGDSYMNYGEPVFTASFTNDSISALALSSYIPDTTRFYIKGKGNYMVAPDGQYDSICYVIPPHPCYRANQIDAFPMRGKLKKVFQSDSIPDANKLTSNEVFSAAVTENGYGVELAIPWKYFKNWNANASNKKPLKPGEIFFYRESLEAGNGNYKADSVKDNAGSCCHSFAKSGNVNVAKSVTVDEIIPDSLYRFRLSYTNTTNVAEEVELERIYYNDIFLGGSSLAANSNNHPTLLNFYPDYNCNGIVDPGEYPQCSCYSDTPTIIIPPYGTQCIIVDIASPYHNQAPQGTFSFESSVLFHVRLELCDAAGSRVINPVGTVKTKVGTSGLSSEPRPDSSSTSGALQEVKVYPNPNAGSFKVYLKSKSNTKLILYDVYGRFVQQRTSDNLSVIEMHGVQTGAYFLKVVFENGQIVTKKIIVQ